MTLPATPSFGKRPLFAIFCGAVLARLVLQQLLGERGYFDSLYYLHVAENMVAGDGMTESVIFTYLDEPEGLPRPSHQYWMPMATLLSWLGIKSLGSVMPWWRAAEIPFVLLSALLPVFAAAISWHIWRRRAWAIAAALLTIVSPFHVAYWSLPDSTTPHAVAVSACLLAVYAATTTSNRWWWLAAGLGAGVAHLSRIDGIVLILLIAGAVYWTAGQRRTFAARTWDGAVASLGYLLVLIPWWWRQWNETGTPVPGPGVKMMLLTSYDDFFSYGEQITLERYLNSGIVQIVWSRVSAIGFAVLAAPGYTLGVALIAVIPILRVATRHAIFRPFLAYVVLLVLFVPVLSPFPIFHGVMLHSAAALAPWLAALLPAAVSDFMHRFAAKRGLANAARASKVALGAVLVSSLLTCFILLLYVDPTSTLRPTRATQWLAVNTAPGDRVLVSSPPVFHAESGREALMAPVNGPRAAAEVARRYGASWLILNSNFIEGSPLAKSTYAPMWPGGNSPNWREVARFEGDDVEVLFELIDP